MEEAFNITHSVQGVKQGYQNVLKEVYWIHISILYLIGNKVSVMEEMHESSGNEGEILDNINKRVNSYFTGMCEAQ